MSIFNSCSAKQLKILLVFFLLILIAYKPVIAMTGTSANNFPLPLFEMESVVKTWLSDSGYKIDNIHHETGRTDITFVNQDSTWTLHLTSRSALVTEIRADVNPEKQGSRDRLQDLWAYVAKYIDPSESKPNTDTRQSAPELILSKAESAVCIKALVNGKEFQISGFIIDSEGLIICTAHNLSDTRTVTVIFNDGEKITGIIKKINFRYDLALIRVSKKFKTAISLKQGRNMLEMGERLFSIGCPANISGTIYAGVVNSPPRRSKDLPLWQVNMEIHPGSSGSPVFDEKGNLVAVIKGRFRGTESIGFLIPYETLIDFLDE